MSYFFVVLIFFVFLVFLDFSGVQGMEDDFVKICGTGIEMVVGELDSVLATTSRCMPSAQAGLACVCAQRFVLCVCAQLLFIQTFKQQVAKTERATTRSIFEQAPEPREPGERAG